MCAALVRMPDASQHSDKYLKYLFPGFQSTI